MRKDLKRILQKAVYACLLLCVAFYSVAQTVGVPQDENLVVGGTYVSPAPVVTGSPMQMCFIFEATNGATLKEAQGEEIRFTVGFNRVDFATLGNATITTEYNVEGTQNFIEWTYYPVPREWRGIIKKSLATLSGARVCISNITAGTATRQQADEFDGIGFLVDMTPHHRDPSSGDTDDEEERYTYSVVPTNLAITKVVNNATPTVGENVTFTVTATNNGPGNATGVVVNEPLPSGYTLVSTTPSTGTYTAPNWTIGNLANGASATMTVVATVNGTGSYANTVTIGGNEPDPDPMDNTDTETPTPTPAQAPAIALVKTGILSTDGNTITYTFTVRNTGNVVLNPVVVNDPKLMPSNVTLGATTLAPGAETTGTATYTVTAAEKAAGQVTNTATATGTPPTGNPVTDVSGTEFTNNTPTVVPVPTADLSVTKTASSLTPSIGSQITFTIVATNNGPGNATGVVVNESLPSGYTLVSAIPSTGTYTAPNWAIGNLANGASATMTVIATVNATGLYANTVTIDGNEPDPDLTNNTDTETVIPKRCPDGVNCLTAKVTRK